MRCESGARGGHVSYSDGASRTYLLILTLPTVHLGGQMPTCNCPLTGHMHLTLQTHTRQLRAFTNTPPRARPCAPSLQLSTSYLAFSFLPHACASLTLW
jgi:hypothetical protein